MLPMDLLVGKALQRAGQAAASYISAEYATDGTGASKFVP